MGDYDPMTRVMLALDAAAQESCVGQIREVLEKRPETTARELVLYFHMKHEAAVDKLAAYDARRNS